MLNLCNSKSILSSFSNTKCAEIFFQTVDNFAIVCTFCEIKSFDFQDFVLHFRNVHMDGTGAALPIKDELVPQSECSEATEVQIVDVEELTSANIELNDNNPLLTSLLYDNENSSHSESSIGCDMLEEADDAPITPKVQPKQFQCNECGVKYKVRKSLAFHKKRVHDKEKKQKCIQCESAFSDERALMKHVRRDHTVYPCDQCDNIYKSKRSFEYHKLKHSGVLNFVCDIENCGKAFFHVARLRAHKKFTHAKERKYVCEICGFGLKSKQALNIHTRSHTGEKPFACEECGKGFASSSQVSEHKAIHSSEKTHVCDVCGAAFARPKALYHHKHLHLGVKKFVCKICGKAYAQAAGLCGHMRQHKAEYK